MTEFRPLVSNTEFVDKCAVGALDVVEGSLVALWICLGGASLDSTATRLPTMSNSSCKYYTLIYICILVNRDNYQYYQCLCQIIFPKIILLFGIPSEDLKIVS